MMLALLLALAAIALLLLLLWPGRRTPSHWLRCMAENWGLIPKRGETDEQLRERLLRLMRDPPFRGTLSDVRLLFAEGSGCAEGNVRVRPGAPGEVVITVPAAMHPKWIELGLASCEREMPVGTLVTVEKAEDA